MRLPEGQRSTAWVKRLPKAVSALNNEVTVVDIASLFKEAGPLNSKESSEVASTFQKIYKRGPLKWSQLLQVDPGREFMGAVTKEMEKTKQNCYSARAH